MKCPQCGTENPDEALVCSSCGNKFEQRNSICEACGAENSPAARFCLNCGHAFGGKVDKTRNVSTTIKPAGDIAASSKPGTKIAAVCVWIVSAVLAVMAFTVFAPSPAELQACISEGGSGVGCAASHFPAPLFWVLAILGAGYGGKLWIGRK